MGFAILTMNKELPAIIERIDGLRDLFIEKFKENSENHLRIENQNVNDHNRIETQAIKTNGRLRMLEKFMWCCGGGMATVLMKTTYQTCLSQEDNFDRAFPLLLYKQTVTHLLEPSLFEVHSLFVQA